jgi:hypothetical protein
MNTIRLAEHNETRTATVVMYGFRSPHVKFGYRRKIYFPREPSCLSGEFMKQNVSL